MKILLLTCLVTLALGREQERQDKVPRFVVPVPQALVYETMPYPVLAPSFLPVAQPPVMPAVLPVLEPEIMESIRAQQTALPKGKPMPFLPSATSLNSFGPQIPNQPLFLPQIQPVAHQVPQVILQPFPQVAPLLPAQPQQLSPEPTAPQAPQHVQPSQLLQLYRALRPETTLRPATRPLAQDYAHVIEEEEEGEGEVLHHHHRGGEHHLQEAELAIHRGGHLCHSQEALGVAEGVLHNSRERLCGSRGARGKTGGKRKVDGYNQPDSKRPQTNNQQNWSSQPNAHSRFSQGGEYSGNYGYNNDNQEFYQDTYGQQWKWTSEGLKMILSRFDRL
ncbi:Heterogeneous nuclear ribonucleoprotein R [Fukomys damarensis]|uniref:Heterogeneous nuclear ribonucleoprotein R n=1 Tax=Fukomys damarensis TaxID=885580 RepID=A0A091DJ34_FUKDA|nr:Heterogeneous nuclear ribonucleoprotein R [Fukomys damarensis]